MNFTKKCLICKDGRKNDCLFWHIDPDEGSVWVWCQGRCQRGYSIFQYCALAGVSLHEFLKQDFDFIEAKNNEVQRMEFPRSFIPMYDKKAEPGVSYLKNRNIVPDDGMYFDTWRNGVVFPYYYENVFVGAQVRLINPWTDEHGEERKIDTLPGTRLGLLFYGWNQTPLPPQTKAVIVTEGAINALSISQSLNTSYESILQNPWRCIATSGSGASKHHIEVLKELRDSGIKIISAPDNDEAGLKMLAKLIKNDVITHYALTDAEGEDWNDVYQKCDQKTFAKWFLERIQSV